jgi:anti-anti-sigma factor
MNLTVTQRDLQQSRVAIRVEGELDLATVGDLRATVTEALERRIRLMVLDLSECDFIDSSGVGAVLEVHRSLAHSGPSFVVVAGAQPYRVLHVTGLADMLPVFTSLPEALHTMADGDGTNGSPAASSSG